MKKKALITGITGQDGSYLAELLLQKNYEVHGIKRRASSFNTSRIDHLYEDTNDNSSDLFLHYGDMTDSANLFQLLESIKPDEVYNLAAQSHVAVSFEEPIYTANTDALGALRLLEGIRVLGLGNKTRYYQASTSELYGLVQETPQTESTPFYPRSPYAVSKLYAYWITKNYREAYGLYTCNGILFNHESPVRGETFVTRKITMALTKIYLGLQKNLNLGNLNSLRDWGHAKDYVTMQWLMLQQETPDDYVISSGEQHSVRDFVNETASVLGMKLEWKGYNENEVAFWKNPIINESYFDNNPIVKVDPRYYRPAEVETLLGDSTKARETLGWTPTISFKELVRDMVMSDLRIAKTSLIIKEADIE